jgi:hypothetical protein
MPYRVMVVDRWESWTHPFFVEHPDRRDVLSFETYDEATRFAADIKGLRYIKTWVEEMEPEA